MLLAGIRPSLFDNSLTVIASGNVAVGTGIEIGKSVMFPDG